MKCLSTEWVDRILFFSLTLMHFSTGFGFLFKIPDMYYPEAYIVNGKPGDGTSEFENLARIPFGLCYISPFVGLIYAHISGSRHAKQSSILCPIVYHLISTFGCIFLFNDALNKQFASIYFASGMHLAMLFLCSLYFWIATDSHHHDHIN